MGGTYRVDSDQDQPKLEEEEEEDLEMCRDERNKYKSEEEEEEKGSNERLRKHCAPLLFLILRKLRRATDKLLNCNY